MALELHAVFIHVPEHSHTGIYKDRIMLKVIKNFKTLNQFEIFFIIEWWISKK